MSVAACALIVGCSASDGDSGGSQDGAESVGAVSLGVRASPAAGTQMFSSVAFDGAGYLVVWAAGQSFGDIFGGSGNVFGTRVSRAGLPLDPSGIPIATGETSGFPVAVAFDGSNYLVVRTGLAGIIGTLVSRAGVVLTPSGIPIAPASDTEILGSFAVACGGADCLVVWDRFAFDTGDNDIRGARVSRAGVVLDPGGFDIATTSKYEEFPKVAFDGTNYLVIWDALDVDTFTADVRGARVSQGGAVLDPAGVFIGVMGSGSGGKSVACGGPSCLVTWNDAGTAVGARISKAGTVLDPSGIPISTAGGVSSSAFDGTNYLIVLEAEKAVLAKRVSQDGVVVDPEEITISTFGDNFKNPSVAFDDTSYLVTWNDRRILPDDHVFGAQINRAGAVLGPENGRLLSTAGPSKP